MLDCSQNFVRILLISLQVISNIMFMVTPITLCYYFWRMLFSQRLVTFSSSDLSNFIGALGHVLFQVAILRFVQILETSYRSHPLNVLVQLLWLSRQIICLGHFHTSVHCGRKNTILNVRRSSTSCFMRSPCIYLHRYKHHLTQNLRNALYTLALRPHLPRMKGIFRGRPFKMMVMAS